MENSKIPEGVKTFTYRYITSLEQLEVLFFLHKNSNNEYNAETINQEIKTNNLSIENKLNDLLNKGFIILTDSQNKKYKYCPKTDILNLAVNEIFQFYKNNYHTLVSLIYSKPMDNIRSFADSFKLRKDD